jgi:hypothetical protein
MFFSILDSKLNDKFYKKIKTFNPFDDDASPSKFTIALKKWITNVASKTIITKFITLDTHYKYDRFNDMVKLLNVVNKREIVSYLQDDTTSIIVVISTIHTTREIPIVWKGSN